MREEIDLIIFMLFDSQITESSKIKNISIEVLVDSIFKAFKAKSSLYKPIHTRESVQLYNEVLWSNLNLCLKTRLISDKKYKDAIASYEHAMKIIYNTIQKDENYINNPAYLKLHQKIFNCKT